MNFLYYVLEPPTYGWTDGEGNLVKPTTRQILREFFSRLNIFKDRKNWLSFLSWLMVLALAPFFFLFVIRYFSLPLLAVTFVYSMIIMGTHGTIWYHRYCTHQAYTFSHPFWRFVTRNLTLKIIPEEVYVVSHHVHHFISDKPGDPYNAQGGFLYCFLADVNHQPIARNLSREDYNKTVQLMRHTGIHANTYEQYQKWGSIANPAFTLLHLALNWAFWFMAFYLLGGMPLVCALFGGACFWAVGVRTFNYEGHGKGKDLRRDGIDFNQKDRSVNQLWPGFVAGEWHNNHHLYPNSARSGFLRYQIDFAWYYVRLLHLIGAVKSYHDGKKHFIENYVNTSTK